MKVKFITFMIIFFWGIKIYSFPGDHNSLTCDKNYYGIKAELFSTDENLKNKYSELSTITEFHLQTYYRSNFKPGTYQFENRKNIVKAIEADFKKPFAQSIVKQNIRNSHKNNDNGRVIHLTKWGDSLSDFVQFYVMGPAYPDYNLFKNQGIWGGGIGPIDSWDDYFSIFGSPSNSNVVFVQNYGIATYTTTGVLNLINIDLENTDINWWDARITGSHCVTDAVIPYFLNLRPAHGFNGQSALRSSYMISGNDIFAALSKWIPLFPFLGSNLVTHLTDNISFMVDWHIENGKKILLEGTLPALSGPIKPYNSLVISRSAICRPFDETFIPPQKIPWWICALGPGYCAQLQRQTAQYYETIIRELKRFSENLVEMKPFPELNREYAPNFFNNPVGYVSSALSDLSSGILNGLMDLANIPNSMPPDGGESKMDHPIGRMISITLACVNDRIAQDLGPSYKQNFPNNVDYLPLYDSFNFVGGNNFAPNFWVPKPNMYRKYLGSITANKNHDLGYVSPDPIHIGPSGYRLWGEIEGTWLKQKEWNRVPIESDYPEPVINLDNDGPGKKIKKKALAINWFGRETSQTLQLDKATFNYPSDTGTIPYGGYYRKYTLGRIFVQQVRDLTDATNESKFGDAFSVSGLLLDRYLQEGGPAGRLGFPTSDPYLAHFNSIDRVNFQCGYIDHNQMNILEPSNTYVHITSNACRNINKPIVPIQ